MKNSLRLALIALLLTAAHPALASDERMVGKIPVSKPRAEGERPVPPRQTDERMAGTKKKSGDAKTTAAKTAPKPKAADPAPDTKTSGESAIRQVSKPDPSDGNPAARAAEKTTEKPDEKPAVQPASAPDTATSAAAATPRPRTGNTMDRKAMENLGPLLNPLKGGLGTDMWDGSARSTLLKYIPELPSGDSMRAAQNLARRVLLSNGDVGMLRNDAAIEPGRDVFTLRLEKLLDIGAYDDAVSLYTLIEGEPPHDRLGRAGIMALMYGGFPAQACLEARAVHHNLAATADDTKFWNQIEAVCTFIQVQSVKAVTRAGFIPASLAGFDRSAVTGVPGSRILTTLASRPDYRHVVASPKDIAELDPIERAVIKGLGRFDYARLKLKKLHDISGPVLMIMATDPNVPTAQRAVLNIEAARRGIVTPEMLGDVYVDLASRPADKTEERIWNRFAAYSKATDTAEKRSIITGLLEQKISSSFASLLPFAEGVSDIKPGGLTRAALQKGLYLMLYAGMVPPERWVTAWLEAESGDSEKNPDSILLYLANILPENLPTNSITFPDDSLKTLLTGPESAKSLEIWSLFSGLGRENVLHSVASQGVYEKHVDLTLHNDYVMPTVGLVELIRDASNNGRLGEVALLAAVALDEYEPGKTHPGVLRDVLQSLVTVGLKEEAQQVALGVVLSFKQ